MKSIIIMISLFLSFESFSQITLKGKVLDTKNSPLPGVIVHFQNKLQDAVLSDQDGDFSINKATNDKILIFKSLGYITDSLSIKGTSDVSIILKESSENLQEVVVRGQATIVDRLSPIHTEIITSKSLAKAACCNLSESFETNASVSVSYTDAVTGAKQIQLLGLAGIYVQNNIENIPNLRGLASTFGLNYVPGTWIQSIDVAKGVGSVVNGYENIAGAINVELQKPELAERVFLNTYVNNFGRAEINLNLAKKINPKWSVGLLSHGSLLKSKVDNNGDGFLDLPTYDQINLLNRWKYSSDKLMAQFGVKVLRENRVGGQKDFESRTITPNAYGFTNLTNRIEVFSKTARLYPEKPYKGLGLILNAILHDSKSYFGFKPYDGRQSTLYGNLIYQNIIGNTNHTYKAGLSFLNDNFDEKYGSLAMKRNEIVPGAFVEYTYNNLDRSVLLLGVRNDYHNLFGNQISPRIHFKQDIGQNDTWRISLGRGFRVPNPLADYFGNLVSSRSIRLLDGIQPEIAWTLGTSYMKQINKLSISTEFYYTNFTKQMVADFEHPDFGYFYISEGKAFNKSGLLEFNYAPNSSWDMKLAYRYTQSKLTIGKPFDEKMLADRMFLSRDRILLNVGYALPYDKWKIDGTLQWNGKRRIPNTGASYDHVSYYAMPIGYAPAFINLNGQVTRAFRKFEYYLGGENLTGFKQQNPIINANKPFSNDFDAGMAWGPILGATVYLGFRYKLI